MADVRWRQNPNIQAARVACQSLDAEAIILIAFLPEGKFRTGSYGKDATICRIVANVADDIHDGIVHGTPDLSTLDAAIRSRSR